MYYDQKLRFASKTAVFFRRLSEGVTSSAPLFCLLPKRVEVVTYSMRGRRRAAVQCTWGGSMVDVFSREKRSWVMSQVKHWDTKPERVVRSLLHRMGYRFRLHRADLPGKPDIVLPRYRKVVLVHGCFWHGHLGCRRATRPTSNTNFWNARLDGNMERDRTNQRRLRRMGWGVLVVWECETTRLSKLEARLRRFLA